MHASKDYKSEVRWGARTKKTVVPTQVDVENHNQRLSRLEKQAEKALHENAVFITKQNFNNKFLKEN